MRGRAERVEVGSKKIGTGLTAGVQSFGDGQEEGVVEVAQLKMREEEERKRKAMQSEEAKADADAAAELVVAVGVVVVVDKSSSGIDQRSIKDGCNMATI